MLGILRPAKLANVKCKGSCELIGRHPSGEIASIVVNAHGGLRIATRTRSGPCELLMHVYPVDPGKVRAAAEGPPTLSRSVAPTEQLVNKKRYLLACEHVIALLLTHKAIHDRPRFNMEPLP